MYMKKYNNSYYLITLLHNNEIINLEKNLLLRRLNLSEDAINTLIRESIEILEKKSYPSCLRYNPNFPDDYDEKEEIERSLQILLNRYQEEMVGYKFNLFEIPRIIYDLSVIYIYCQHFGNDVKDFKTTKLYDLLKNNPVGNNLQGYNNEKIIRIRRTIEREKYRILKLRDEYNPNVTQEEALQLVNEKEIKVRVRWLGEIVNVINSEIDKSVVRDKLSLILPDQEKKQLDRILEIIYSQPTEMERLEANILKLEEDMKKLRKYQIDNLNDYKQVATEIFNNNVDSIIELNYKIIEVLLELDILNYDFEVNSYNEWEEILVKLIEKFNEVNIVKYGISLDRLRYLEINSFRRNIDPRLIESDIDLFKEVLFAESTPFYSDKLLLYRGGETTFKPLKYDAHTFYNNEIIMLPENVEPWDKDENGFIYLIKNPTNTSNPEKKYFEFEQYYSGPIPDYFLKHKFRLDPKDSYIFSRTYTDKVDPSSPLINKTKPKSFSYNLAILNGIFFDSGACTYVFMKKHKGYRTGEMNYKVAIKKPYYNQISEESKKRKLNKINCSINRNCELKEKDFDVYMKLSEKYSLYLQGGINLDDFVILLKRFYYILEIPLGELSIYDRIKSDIDEAPTNTRLIKLKPILEQIKKEHELTVVPSLKKIIDDRFIMDNLFFVPPLSPIFQLMGIGELWHVRTKLYKDSYKPFIDNYRDLDDQIFLHQSNGNNYNKDIHYKVPQYLISDLGLQETIKISEALYRYNRINMLNRESDFKGKTETTHQRMSLAEAFGGGLNIPM